MILLVMLIAILAGMGVLIALFSSILGGVGALVAFVAIDIIVVMFIKVLSK